MGFHEDFRRALERAATGKFRNTTNLARQAGVQQASLSRYFTKNTGINIDAVAKLADAMGAKLVFPEDEQEHTVKDVQFISAHKVSAPRSTLGPSEEDYLAVPLAATPVAAGPGLIPEDKIRGWILVWRHQEAVLWRSNLVAVELGRGENSMAPTLHPGDIVLVDRNDREPEPAGKIMLVSEPGPDGGAMIKRVSTQRLDNDVELVFYSDNSREFPPRTFRLGRDYEGDLTRAIAGRVIWAWSDMSHK
jgi:hypothetical protein